MFRPQFSYWITVSADKKYRDERDALSSTFYDNGITSPEGGLTAEYDAGNNTFELEVDEDEGTVEYSESLTDAIAETARQFPHWKFEVEAINEEGPNGSFVRIFENGKERKIKVEEAVKYYEFPDRPTLAKAITELRRLNMPKAADALEKGMW